MTASRRSWTTEEDEMLRNIIAENGEGKWAYVAAHIPGRSAKQCRERWHNHVDPRVHKGPWSQEEDKILLEAAEKCGTRWALIGTQLPGRSDNSIKNRYFWHKRRINNPALNEQGQSIAFSSPTAIRLSGDHSSLIEVAYTSQAVEQDEEFQFDRNESEDDTDNNNNNNNNNVDDDDENDANENEVRESVNPHPSPPKKPPLSIMSLLSAQPQPQPQQEVETQSISHSVSVSVPQSQSQSSTSSHQIRPPLPILPSFFSLFENEQPYGSGFISTYVENPQRYQNESHLPSYVDLLRSISGQHNNIL